MEKIFANPLSDNTLIFIIYKGHIQLKNKTQIAQFFKWTKDMDKHFFNLVVLMANKYMKRCLTALISGGGAKSLQSCPPVTMGFYQWDSLGENTGVGCRALL